MNVKLRVMAVAMLSAPLVGASSSGPVRLLSCAVDRTGILEAEVDNSSDSVQTCHLRCDYVIREAPLSHPFEVTVPARYRGRVGQFNTSSGRPGTYAGKLGACQSRPNQ